MIPIIPMPTPPCFFCNSGRSCKVRFLNAANGYRPFRISINGRMIFTRLGYASVTGYGQVADGFQTVTVSGANGYVYLQKTVPFRAGDSVTLAIITTAGGIDLLPISDLPCTKPYNMSCFRVCNLAYGSNPLDVILYDGRVVYTDVRYKEVTTFKRIRPGDYQFYVAETSLSPMPHSMDIETLDSAFDLPAFPEAIVTFDVEVSPNAMYTVFLLNGSNSALQPLVLRDQL